MERRALYNSLRIHYQQDPSIEAEPWQVADYRRESANSLIEQLGSFNIHLDRHSFAAYADSCESPEQLSEEFCSELHLDPEEEDYIYLLIFELWRRFVPEKQTLSLFCDELDYQIGLFDQDQSESLEPLEDALANLQYLLTEQVDEGDDPMELFENVKLNCAHDLESFLYDFIALQIENENLLYASEVLEGYNDFVEDPKWLALLKVRLLIATDPEEAGHLVDNLRNLTDQDLDLDFHLEFLALLVQEGDKETFFQLVSTILPLIEKEEDFVELLELCRDYFHCLDEEENEKRVAAILDKRSGILADHPFKSSDKHAVELKSVF